MHKAALYSISLYLVLAPYIQLPGLGIGYYDSKRVLQLILFTFLGLYAIVSLIKYHRQGEESLIPNISITSKLLTISAAIVVLAGFVSVLVSAHIKFALLEYAFLLFLIAGALFILPKNLRNHYESGRVIIFTSVIYSAIYLTVFWGGYISSFFDPMIPVWPDRLPFSVILEGIEYKGTEVLYFVHKRFFNHTQTWTLPILVGLLAYIFNRQKNEKLLKIVLVILVSFWWMLLFASGGRGSVVALLTALGCLALFFGKDSFPLIKNGFTTIIFGGGFYYIFFRLMTTDQLPLMRTTDSGRIMMWERALDLWSQGPFFGIGPMHYAQIIDSAPYFAGAHNFYLQFLTEWGGIAFVALMIILIIFGRFVLKNYSAIKRNEPNKLIYIAFVWSMTSGLMYAAISGPMNTPMSQIWFMLIVAWFMGFIRYSKLPVQKFKINFNPQILLLILLVIILTLTLTEIPHLQDGYQEYMNEYPGQRFNPRFWEQGLFP